MYEYQLRILAQYQENYAAHNEDWDGVTEHWKMKGGADFVVGINSAMRMYLSNDEVTKVIETILAKRSNDFGKYTLISFEYSDGAPEDLTEAFKTEATKLLNIEAAKSGEVYEPTKN